MEQLEFEEYLKLLEERKEKEPKLKGFDYTGFTISGVYSEYAEVTISVSPDEDGILWIPWNGMNGPASETYTIVGSGIF